MAIAKDIILALGTNKNQEMNMFMAELLIKKMLPDIIFTRGLWTDPIGLESEKFLNKLAFTRTSRSFAQMHRALKHVEKQCGNIKAERRKGVVKMDIDILCLGEEIMHEEDWKRDYVKELLKELPTNKFNKKKNEI